MYDVTHTDTTPDLDLIRQEFCETLSSFTLDYDIDEVPDFEIVNLKSDRHLIEAFRFIVNTCNRIQGKAARSNVFAKPFNDLDRASFITLLGGVMHGTCDLVGIPLGNTRTQLLISTIRVLLNDCGPYKEEKGDKISHDYYFHIRDTGELQKIAQLSKEYLFSGMCDHEVEDKLLGCWIKIRYQLRSLVGQKHYSAPMERKGNSAILGISLAVSLAILGFILLKYFQFLG